MQRRDGAVRFTLNTFSIFKIVSYCRLFVLVFSLYVFSFLLFHCVILSIFRISLLDFDTVFFFDSFSF